MDESDNTNSFDPIQRDSMHITSRGDIYNADQSDLSEKGQNEEENKKNKSSGPHSPQRIAIRHLAAAPNMELQQHSFSIYVSTNPSTFNSFYRGVN